MICRPRPSYAGCPHPSQFEGWGPFSDDCRGPMAAATSNTCPVLILPIYVVSTISATGACHFRDCFANFCIAVTLVSGRVLT